MKQWIGAAALVLLAAGPAQAEVYKCEVGGKTVFQGMPCEGEGGAFKPSGTVSTMNSTEVEAPAATSNWLEERAERQRQEAKQLRAHQNEQDRIQQAFENGNVTKGMTQSQVQELWGPPWESLVEIDESGRRCVTWYWGGPIRAERPEATFCGGIVTKMRAYGG
ncbi:protein of unknown function [Halomonas shengliensis]|uniref:DUF4124 domain-containing protein n=1 Tax=Halomonas shengliensis TaxID=419597 RepID=A0A1H0IET4_9GAMM|nr:DUF4124 domain-containing protein [Halomonas shengliensis]SDO29865.1 protein of unknown function [Halomonas shengliensis]